MLTMLGFVILTGVVVNNAILMIEQTSLHIREDGMSVDEAILEAKQSYPAYFHVNPHPLPGLCHW